MQRLAAARANVGAIVVVCRHGGDGISNEIMLLPKPSLAMSLIRRGSPARSRQPVAEQQVQVFDKAAAVMLLQKPGQMVAAHTEMSGNRIALQIHMTMRGKIAFDLCHCQGLLHGGAMIRGMAAVPNSAHHAEASSLNNGWQPNDRLQVCWMFE